MKHAGLILMLLASVALGFATTYGLTGKLEPYLWTLLSIVAAIVIVKTRPRRPVLYAFLVSFCVMIATFIAAANFDLYLRNNPDAAQQYALLPPSLSPRLFLIVTAPVTAILYGLVTGGITWIVNKVWRRKPPQPPTPRAA